MSVLPPWRRFCRQDRRLSDKNLHRLGNSAKRIRSTECQTRITLFVRRCATPHLALTGGAQLPVGYTQIIWGAAGGGVWAHAPNGRRHPAAQGWQTRRRCRSADRAPGRNEAPCSNPARWPGRVHVEQPCEENRRYRSCFRFPFQSGAISCMRAASETLCPDPGTRTKDEWGRRQWGRHAKRETRRGGSAPI